jgi:hypothetical protein
LEKEVHPRGTKLAQLQQRGEGIRHSAMDSSCLTFLFHLMLEVKKELMGWGVRIWKALVLCDLGKSSDLRWTKNGIYLSSYGKD